jgi:hypothetical protein
VCSGTQYAVGTYANPFDGAATCTISGYVNDDLVVNGSVVDTGGQPCPYGSCACAHDFTYSLDVAAGDSVTIAVQNNYDPGWAIDGTICFTPKHSPPP